MPRNEYHEKVIVDYLSNVHDSYYGYTIREPKEIYKGKKLFIINGEKETLVSTVITKETKKRICWLDENEEISYYDKTYVHQIREDIFLIYIDNV